MIAGTQAENQSDAESTIWKDTPYLAVTGELWGCLLQILWKDWSRYDDIFGLNFTEGYSWWTDGQYWLRYCPGAANRQRVGPIIWINDGQLEVMRRHMASLAHSELVCCDTNLQLERNWPISQIPQCICPKSHNAPYCNRNVQISVTKWCIVGCLSDALWDLGDGPIRG